MKRTVWSIYQRLNIELNKHIELTADIIASADRVLYVMGKSVTETDQNFAKSILESGVKIIFVRTHMDDLKDSEESVSETVKQEKSTLSNYTDIKEEIFFVSNDESNEYYGEINRLKNYLSQNLAENIEQILNESIAEGMKFIAQKVRAGAT